MQPVAWAMMASLPMALQAHRTARASPQPWQDRCPEVKNSSRGIIREAYVSNFVLSADPNFSISLLPHRIKFLAGSLLDFGLGVPHHFFKGLGLHVPAPQAHGIARGSGAGAPGDTGRCALPP